MPIVGWRVWYDDDSIIVGHTFADWEALPDDGVLYVKHYYDRDSRLGIPLTENQNACDYYFATPSGIYGASSDTWEDIQRRYPDASIKRGKWTTAEQMDAVAVRVHDANDRP